jgi:hypothetical protein
LCRWSRPSRLVSTRPIATSRDRIRVTAGWLMPNRSTASPMVIGPWRCSTESKGIWLGCVGRPASAAMRSAPACSRSANRFNRLPSITMPSAAIASFIRASIRYT